MKTLWAIGIIVIEDDVHQFAGWLGAEGGGVFTDGRRELVAARVIERNRDSPRAIYYLTTYPPSAKPDSRPHQV
jgi:hypothetical protein